MGLQTLNISDLSFESRLQMRETMSAEVVEQYAEDFDKLPPPKVVLDEDGHYFPTDGWHTIKAAHKLGRAAIRCDVKSGTFQQALFDAAGANHGHGLRITSADKRKKVATLIAFMRETDQDWSAVAIASICRVGHALVSKMIAEARPSDKRPDDSEASTGEASESEGGNSTGGGAALFCGRCQRVGPVKDCPKCRELQKAAGRKRRTPDKGGKAKAKAGDAAYDRREKTEHCGKLARLADKLAHQGGFLNAKRQPSGPEHAGLIRQIEALEAAFDDYEGSVKKAGQS